VLAFCERRQTAPNLHGIAHKRRRTITSESPQNDEPLVIRQLVHQLRQAGLCLNVRSTLRLPLSRVKGYGAKIVYLRNGTNSRSRGSRRYNPSHSKAPSAIGITKF
jgi:hypothetical protein